MLRNTVVNTVNFFYPIGNTPAVCLTQDLPPEQDASVLLLGCGDARNILFTTYTDPGVFHFASAPTNMLTMFQNATSTSHAAISSPQSLVY